MTHPPCRDSRPILSCGLVLLASLSFLSRSGHGQDAVSLAPADVLAPSRVRIVFEVDGHLLAGNHRADDPAGAANRRTATELKAKGEFLYEERLEKDRSGRALRFFEQAAAELAVGGQARQVQLRDDRRFISIDPSAATDDASTTSLEGPLMREELELLELPGGSHIVNQLLPARTIRPGETWTHDDLLVAQWLNLTGVTVNELTSRLERLDEKQAVAHLALSGKVIGYAAGVVTEIELAAKYHFDLRARRVTWLAMSLSENRPAGAAKPGLAVKARLRMLIQPATPVHLVPESLETLLAAASTPATLLEYRPDHGRFTMLHDRRWQLYSEQPELTIMRLIDDGQVVAQCNLRSLPPSPHHQTSLDHFQREIRTALGSAATQVVDTQEGMHPSGARQLRVAVVGEVSATPVSWIYYQLAGEEGQLLACVFTMSGENVERFGSEDMALLSSITLAPVTSEPDADRPSDKSEGNDPLAQRPVDAPQ